MTDDEQKKVFANNLKDLLSERNLTQKEVAKAIGVSPQTFNTWIRGVALPRMGKIQKLADYFHVEKSKLIDPLELKINLDDVIEGLDVVSQKDMIVREIPILGTICAGDGIDDKCFQGYFYVDKSIKADYCVRVHGDSMIDAGIRDGDIAFIQKDTDIEDGDICGVVLKDTDEAVLKKIYRTETGLILQPCNSNYKPIVKSADDVLIVGEMVGFYHSTK